MNKPKPVISVMMVTAYVFEQMYLHFKDATGFLCNRETGIQMTKSKLGAACLLKSMIAHDSLMSD